MDNVTHGRGRTRDISKDEEGMNGYIAHILTYLIVYVTCDRDVE